MWPQMDTSESDDHSVHRSQSLLRFTLWHGLDVSHPYFGESRWAYTGMFAAHRLYGQSKLAQMYHARSVGPSSRSILSSESLRELSRLAGERGDNVIAVSLHPGAVSTEITR